MIQKILNEQSVALSEFLDDSILVVQQILEQLTVLRAAVIRRDEKTLIQMRDGLSDQMARRVGMQQRQRRLCESFAGALRCRVEDVTISYMTNFLEEDRKKELKSKQSTLRRLMTNLSMEHKATERLLRECMHLNHKLLECIVGGTGAAMTYGQGGRIQRETQNVLMNFRM